MEPTPAGTTGQKIASLQGLRAIALSGIILYHYGNPNLDLTAAWSVSLFFMLSGYLNGLLWEKGKRPEKDLKSSILYMIRHIKKLYFLHVIITFLSIPISDAIPSIQTEGISKLPFWSVIFFMNLTLTKSLYPKYYWGFNGVSWFLSSYAVLCLLTPLLLHGTAHMLKKKASWSGAENNAASSCSNLRILPFDGTSPRQSGILDLYFPVGTTGGISHRYHCRNVHFQTSSDFFFLDGTHCSASFDCVHVLDSPAPVAMQKCNLDDPQCPSPVEFSPDSGTPVPAGLHKTIRHTGRSLRLHVPDSSDRIYLFSTF